jgi:1-phosphofructokinase family hexose kinase
VLHQLQIPAVAVSPLGGAAGTWIHQDVAERGVTSRPVPIAGESRTTIAIVDGLAHPTVLSESGPILSDAEWRAVAVTVAEAAHLAEYLVISGSLPSAANPALVSAWVAAGQAAGTTVVADVSGPALLAAADAGADLLKPNRDELLAATGLADELPAARLLLERGAGTVVVSRGAEGIAAYDSSGRAIVEPAPTRLNGNPVGAGDAATAGLVAALCRGLSLAQGLSWAAAAGAAAVRVPWAGEIDLPAFTRFSGTGPQAEPAVATGPHPRRRP